MQVPGPDGKTKLRFADFQRGHGDTISLWNLQINTFQGWVSSARDRGFSRVSGGTLLIAVAVARLRASHAQARSGFASRVAVTQKRAGCYNLPNTSRAIIMR